MLYKKIELPVLKEKLIFHTALKNKLLTAIEQSSGEHLKTSCDDISKTDWNIPSSVQREYLEILKIPLLEELKRIYQQFNSTGFQIHNFWYQQYTTGDTHDWHTHQAAQFTNIYYLEFDKTSPKTQIINPMNFKEVIELEAEEGDLITFPASVFHRSPRSRSSSRKTIISFNTSLLNPVPEPLLLL